MLLQTEATCDDQVNLLSNTTPSISVDQPGTKEFYQLKLVTAQKH